MDPHSECGSGYRRAKIKAENASKDRYPVIRHKKYFKKLL
jgi:hypothetical protein